MSKVQLVGDLAISQEMAETLWRAIQISIKYRVGPISEDELTSLYWMRPDDRGKQTEIDPLGFLSFFDSLFKAYGLVKSGLKDDKAPSADDILKLLNYARDHIGFSQENLKEGLDNAVSMAPAYLKIHQASLQKSGQSPDDSKICISFNENEMSCLKEIFQDTSNLEGAYRIAFAKEGESEMGQRYVEALEDVGKIVVNAEKDQVELNRYQWSIFNSVCVRIHLDIVFDNNQSNQVMGGAAIILSAVLLGMIEKVDNALGFKEVMSFLYECTKENAEMAEGKCNPLIFSEDNEGKHINLKQRDFILKGLVEFRKKVGQELKTMADELIKNINPDKSMPYSVEFSKSDITALFTFVAAGYSLMFHFLNITDQEKRERQAITDDQFREIAAVVRKSIDIKAPIEEIFEESKKMADEILEVSGYSNKEAMKA